MTQKTIQLYLLMEVKGLDNLDLSRPDKGNPGVGGTQFCFLLLIYYLQHLAPGRFDITVLSPIRLRLPDGAKNIIYKSLDQLPSLLPENCLLIAKDTSDPSFYDILEKCRNVKVVIWCHNFLFGDTTRRIARMDNIKATVFVGRQMYDFYTDNDIILKSKAIFNIVPDIKTPERVLPSRKTLTFMGQIARHKGILTLMKVWEKVKRKYPEAQLNIIGKGTLYDRNSRLGSLGLAEESLEKELYPYLMTQQGELDPNIHLVGILGSEKYDLFANSTVGIVNPSARTETFGMGIIEMASASLPVVTRNWNGHPDTGINGKTALLSLTVSGMARKICRLFAEEELNLRLGRAAKQQVVRFSPQLIIPEWISLLEAIDRNEKIATGPLPIIPPKWNNYKFIRALNAKLRFGLGLRFLPSIVEYETIGYNFLKKISGR